MKYLLLMLSLLSITPVAFAETVPAPLAEELGRHRLRGMVTPSTSRVCVVMHNRFLAIGEQLGYDRVARSVLATKAIRAMTDVLVKSNAAEFVDVSYVAEAAGLPATKTVKRFVPVAPLFGEAIGLKQVPLVVFSADALKYLPYQQMNSDLVVVTSDATPLNKRRAQRVAVLAKNLNIRIHTLWTGPTPGRTHLGNSQALAWLAAATGGKFVEFTANSCLDRI